MMNGNPLNIQQVYAELASIKSEYASINTNYSGIFSKFKKNIRQEDNLSLVRCMDRTLRLTLEQSVQAELVSAGMEKLHETAFYQITRVTKDLLGFASRFNNTGVSVHKVSQLQ